MPDHVFLPSGTSPKRRQGCIGTNENYRWDGWALTSRRRHAEEFKRQVIAACLQPGISIAAVALANGLNANLLRRWVKDHRDAQEVEVGAEIADQEERPRPPALAPVTVSAPEVEPAGEIKIAIHRAQALVEVNWPVSQAAICAQWLREILR